MAKSFINYKGIQILSPTPEELGGKKLNNNFKELADRIGPVNYSALVDPTLNDDINDGYTIGSIWINQVTEAVFICADNTAGAANWIEIAASTYIPGQFVIISSLIDFTATGNTTLFTVPSNYKLLIDQFEIITINNITPGIAPNIKFGNSIDDESYVAALTTTSNAVNSRHVIENPQNAINSGTIITGGVDSASTAATHTGHFIIQGYLLAT